MTSAADNEVNNLGTAARHAIVQLDRSEKRLRLFTLGVAAIILLIVSTTMIALLLFSTRQLNEIKNNQNSIDKSLQILQTYTNPAALQKNHDNTVQLIHCLANRIDVDTNHGTFDPACKPIVGLAMRITVPSTTKSIVTPNILTTTQAIVDVIRPPGQEKSA